MAARVESEGASTETPPIVADAKAAFDRLRKTLKTIALYRHNVDRYAEYIEPFATALLACLEQHGMLSLKIEPLAYKCKGVVIFEDDARDNNIIYPLWQAGIRLLVFKQGVTPEELQKFILLCMGSMEEARKNRAEDIITALWKAELECIEYIVVEGFKALPDEDLEEVEVELEKVVAYLYRQLQSNSDDYLRFARVSVDDLDLQMEAVDQMRGVVIKGTTATVADRARIQSNLVKEDTRQLAKMVVVLFQLLELDTDDANFEDVAEAFVQLLDALLLQENFTAIDQIRQRFAVSAGKVTLRPGQNGYIVKCAERFSNKMGEAQRIQAIGNVLSNGIAKDPDGIRAYLFSLGPKSLEALLDMLEALQVVQNRRLVADVLAEVGRNHVATFIARLKHPSSNLVKDMLTVIDKINPPNKFTLFGEVLTHPNAILRLETLAVIGRNPAEECFQQIIKVVREHEDPHMRAQAMRLLPNYAPDKSESLVLSIVKNDNFEKLSDPEKKALFTTLVQLRTPAAEAFLKEILEQKSGMFAKKKVDDLKLLLIAGLEGAPSVPGLHLLVSIAQDQKLHSKDVCEGARAAAVNVKARLLGG